MTKAQKKELLDALEKHAYSLDRFNILARQIIESVIVLRDWREPKPETSEYIVARAESIGDFAIRKHKDYIAARDMLAKYLKISTARANTILEHGPDAAIALIEEDL